MVGLPLLLVAGPGEQDAAGDAAQDGAQPQQGARAHLHAVVDGGGELAALVQRRQAIAADVEAAQRRQQLGGELAPVALGSGLEPVGLQAGLPLRLLVAQPCPAGPGSGRAGRSDQASFSSATVWAKVGRLPACSSSSARLRGLHMPKVLPTRSSRRISGSQRLRSFQASASRRSMKAGSGCLAATAARASSLLKKDVGGAQRDVGGAIGDQHLLVGGGQRAAPGQLVEEVKGVADVVLVPVLRVAAVGGAVGGRGEVAAEAAVAPPGGRSGRGGRSRPRSTGTSAPRRARRGRACPAARPARRR